MEIKFTTTKPESNVSILAVTGRAQGQATIRVTGAGHRDVAESVFLLPTVVRLLIEARATIAGERDHLVESDTLRDENGEPRLDTLGEDTKIFVAPLDRMIERIDAAVIATGFGSDLPVPTPPGDQSSAARVLAVLKKTSVPIRSMDLFAAAWPKESVHTGRCPPEVAVGAAVQKLRGLGWKITSRRGRSSPGYVLHQ